MIKERKIIPMYYDKVFKIIFKNNPNLLAKMIADIIGIDYRLLYNNIILYDNELALTKLTEKEKKCDFIVKINDDNLISLELNSYYRDWLNSRNFSYASSLYINKTKTGKKYNKNYVITQININAYYKNKNYHNLEDISKCIMKYMFLNTDTLDTYINDFRIYNIDIVNSYNLLYNLGKQKKDIPNALRWASLIYVRSIDEVDYIMGDVISMEEKDYLKTKYRDIEEKYFKLSEEELKERAMLEYNTIVYEGIEQGIEQSIKKMLKNNMTKEEISKILEISISDIDKLLNK